jgi:hypothetical protein
VDFIWYTPRAGRHALRPAAVLLPPAPDAHLGSVGCRGGGGMPNATIPSDHISLCVDLLLSVAADGGADG